MKQLLFLFLLLFSVRLSAQDIIVKKDRSEVRYRIEEVTDSVISYMIWDDASETCYLIDKSLVSSIIFENGKKETFAKAKSLFDPNAPYKKTSTKPLFDPDDPYKKVRRLRIAGCLGGGVFATLGATFIAMGLAGNPYSAAYGIVYGIPCIILGGAVTVPCLIVAGKKKRDIDAALGMSSIYRHNIPLRDGSSLSVGADLLRDNILHHQTVGLGLSYCF